MKCVYYLWKNAYITSLSEFSEWIYKTAIENQPSKLYWKSFFERRIETWRVVVTAPAARASYFPALYRKYKY